MHRLYSEMFQYQLERHQRLQGEQRRERLTLSDGRRFEIRPWVQRTGAWLLDQLSVLGQNLPCVDNELACDLRLGA